MEGLGARAHIVNEEKEVCWIFSHILVALVGFFRFVVYTTNIYLVGLCVCVGGGEGGH